ncbi:MAG: M28 family metallopeptidase [Bacteroidales bacterium]
MRFCTRLVLLFLAMASVSSAQQTVQRTGAADRAIKVIRGDAIRAHMRFLSSTELAGRGTGTEGYQVAAQYVATQMEAIGLKPAGVNGTWFQNVPLRDYRVVPEQTSLELVREGRTETLKFGDDFVTSGDPLKTDVSVEAGLVFGGFGVTAPELQYDDYAGLDVRGKIVVALFGAPASFPANERAYFSDTVIKIREAVARGAVGVITILTPEDQQRYAWNWIAPQITSGGMNWLGANGVPHDTFPEIRGGALLSPRGADVLFARAPTPLAQVFAEAKSGKLHTFTFPGVVKMRTVSKLSEVQSPNIVGVLTGADPTLRNEYVVYTAHVDHLGLCPPVGGDNVCHGANDNASGTATVLEIARAFASLPRPPRRSVLFVFVTAEEKGMLGSDYFANNPTVPLSAIVANVNVDGAVGLFYAPRDVVAIGAEHSTLAATFATATRRLGYQVSPDPMPEEVIFVRSDQYSFVKKGVPAVMIGGGFKAIDPKINGEAVTKGWMTTIYHTPKDNMDQPWNWQSATKGAALEFLVGYEIAQQNARPSWNTGDFFGTKFARRASAASQ